MRMGKKGGMRTDGEGDANKGAPFQGWPDVVDKVTEENANEHGEKNP